MHMKEHSPWAAGMVPPVSPSLGDVEEDAPLLTEQEAPSMRSLE